MRPIPQAPDPSAMARFGPDFGQRFILTVDTEEEFDWSKPFDRENHGTLHVPRLGKFQTFCENEGVRPIYLVDYPIANSELAGDLLRDAIGNGRADVGIQLHPWVSPPLIEAVNSANSFAGNLPADLEYEKLARLRDRIEQTFGAPPLIYRAGRYGTGPTTAQSLRRLGVAIDTSVRALFDYSAEGGPDYRRHPLHPYWIDTENRQLLELPLTSVFWGMLRRQGGMVYPRLWRIPQMRGVLASLGLLERIPLTPEGVSVDEALWGIDMAIDDGLPVLNFSFHSPSLQPGHTPYVRSESDLDGLYDWWRAIFAYLRERGVQNAAVDDIMAAAVR